MHPSTQPYACRASSHFKSPGFCLVAGLFISACAHGKQAETKPPSPTLPSIAPRVYAPYVLDPAELARAINAASGDFQVRTEADGVSQVHNCREIFGVLTHQPLEVVGAETDYQAFWSAAVRCAALDALASAKASHLSHMREHLTVDARSWLPPQIGLFEGPEQLDAAERAAEACTSWGSFDASLQTKSQEDGKVVVQSELWGAEVALIALADFDGDGLEDMLLRRDGWVDGTTFREASLFLLRQTDEDRCVHVFRQLH